MYEVGNGALIQMRWENDYQEVIEPAVLFEVLRDKQVAILHKHGELSAVREYKKEVEAIYNHVGMDKEYVFIELADLVTDVGEQCRLMNYFVNYTNTKPTYKLAVASKDNRLAALQDILACDQVINSR